MWSFSLLSPHFQKKSLIMKKTHLALSLCLITSMAGSARGQELIINGGFEFPVASAGTGFIFLPTPVLPVFVAAFGWTTSEPAGYEIWVPPNGYLDTAPEGRNLLELNYYSNTAIWQYVTLLPGGTYRYSFMHRGRQGVDQARFDIIDTSTNQVVLSRLVSTGNEGWATYSGDFIATGNSFKVEFKAIYPTADYGNLLDNISLVRNEPCLGDITGNYIVNSVDLAIVLGAWNSSGGEFGADINHDGIVDAMDLGMLLGSWGACYQ